VAIWPFAGLADGLSLRPDMALSRFLFSPIDYSSNPSAGKSVKFLTLPSGYDFSKDPCPYPVIIFLTLILDGLVKNYVMR
jgi:hypothetical protein